MYPVNEVARIFFECVDGSAIEMFRAFLRRHPHVRKWMIAADFSLHNKDRPLDCFAFTMLPYDDRLHEIERDASALPKDLKKSKSLDDEAIDWLRESRRFHVAITVDKNPAVFNNGPGTDALTVAREHIDITLSEISRHAPGSDVEKRFKKLKQDAKAKSFNVELLADIWLLSTWFACLTVLLARERNCEIVGWFPDRDSMTNYCDGIWAHYALWNVQSIAEAFKVDVESLQCPMATPDRSEGKERMWFDYLIRSADWLAGAVAAWDREKNLIPGDHDKYRQMIEDVILDADNIVILHFDMTDSGMQFRRILPTPKTP